MAEVDEIIRAACAAGELVIRLTDFALREGIMISQLIAKAVHDHGGAGPQVPLAKMQETQGARRALAVPSASLPEIRELAEKTGIRFAAAETKNPHTAILVMAEKDLPLMEDILRALDIEGASAMPPSGARDLGIAEFGRGSSFVFFEIEPEDADRFFEAAESEGLMHAASGRGACGASAGHDGIGTGRPAGSGHETPCAAQPVVIVVPDTELSKAREILDLAQVAPRGHTAPAAKVVKVREPLAVRAERARKAAKEASAGLTLVLAHTEASSFRVLAFQAGIPFREDAPRGDAVRFCIPPASVPAARKLLAAAGICSGPAASVRSGGVER